MSDFITAKDQIIKIIKETSPELNVNYGKCFSYQDFNVDEKQDIQSRCFTYALATPAVAPNRGGCELKFGVTLNISVFYREETDRDEMFNCMMSDYELITERLLHVPNWERSDSGIQILSAGEESILIAEIDEESEYGSTLTFSYPLIYIKN